MFSRMLDVIVPYSGTLGARIVELRPGQCRATLKDRRSIRNHLRSVHAMALANLGELASGLALMMLLPAGMRGIVTKFHIEYFKKARGLLTATSEVSPLTSQEEQQLLVVAVITDEQGEIVAKTFAEWTIGPKNS